MQSLRRYVSSPLHREGFYEGNAMPHTFWGQEKQHGDRRIELRLLEHPFGGTDSLAISRLLTGKAWIFS